MKLHAGIVPLLLPLVTFASGCGGGGDAAAPTTATTPPSQAGSSSTTGQTPSGPPGALTAEAQQAAAGDIPDNQVFLTYTDTQAGYSIKAPEGWAEQGAGDLVTFRDKNNLVRIEVADGGTPTLAGITSELKQLQARTPSLTFDPPVTASIGGRQVIKVVYSTKSVPNPVTGKRVELVVDRYEVPGPGKHAVVDLGTPAGVDNVDAYRLMIESFAWK